MRAAPPPTTNPFLTAACNAHTASSIRSRHSDTSSSVRPPGWTRIKPPFSFDMRSEISSLYASPTRRFSCKKSSNIITLASRLETSSVLFLICPWPPTKTVLFLLILTDEHLPSTYTGSIFDNRIPKAYDTTYAPVNEAMSCSTLMSPPAVSGSYSPIGVFTATTLTLFCKWFTTKAVKASGLKSGAINNIGFCSFAANSRMRFKSPSDSGA